MDMSPFHFRDHSGIQRNNLYVEEENKTRIVLKTLWTTGMEDFTCLYPLGSSKCNGLINII